MNRRKLIALTGILLILGVLAAWKIFKKPEPGPAKENNQEKATVPTPEDQRKRLDAQLPALFEMMTRDEGTLAVSDDPEKGNLMLLRTDTRGFDKIYIQTSRDYSALLGKQVRVLFKSGIAPEFTLDDIVPIE